MRGDEWEHGTEEERTESFFACEKGQPLPDCPFRLKVTGKTDVDVIVGDEAVTKKVQKKDNHSLPV